MEKSTGWKVPLLFCAVVILLVGALQLWRSATAPDVTPLDAALLARADGFHINLPADERGRYYQKAIANAATGFQPRSQKDAALRTLYETAIADKRFDAACTAVTLINDSELREKLLDALVTSASGDCATLPWGAFAARAMRDPDHQNRTHSLLNQLWARCPRS
ncbi:hypothetical protein [uncultured Desulfovibrio sp.]|uniref:hypothetical protein n=1 Tax=uncultured Desulfovibrio sp. TaxID=167968 RepID=UPI0026280D91|nr:hypothetical protein [uncultured Desulfovibrio sp.]